MINWLLVISKLGKVRLRRWYKTVPLSDKQKTISDISLLVLQRSKQLANIIDYKGVDEMDNELAGLEMIHRFVQALDAAFGNVTELDILFGMLKAYSVLDELFIGGEFEESSLIEFKKCMADIANFETEELLKESLGVFIDD